MLRNASCPKLKEEIKAVAAAIAKIFFIVDLEKLVVG